MPLMTRIPSDLHRFGLTVELVPGWETRSAGSFNPGGVVCHWTAGPKASKSRPSLSVVVNGRAGLSGPLCNVYLDRNGVCVVVAAGRANHAGEGGYKGMVGNSAVYGIEAECGGDGDWTPAQKKVYPILVAALLSGVSRDASWACGHNEWAPTRKIDIRDWPMPAMRQQVAAALGNPSNPNPGNNTGDDMLPEERQWLSDVRLAVLGGMPAGQNNFHWLERNTRQFEVFRSDPVTEVNGKKGSGLMVLAAPGIWYGIPGIGHLNMFITHGLCSPDYQNVTWNVFDLYQSIYLSMRADVDEAAIAKAVQDTIKLPEMPPVDIAITDEQIAKLAALLDDETAEEWKAKMQQQAQATAEELAKRLDGV